MAEDRTHARIDLDQIEELQEAERPRLKIRWWVLPLALVLCAAQAAANQLFENRGTGAYLIATQVSVIAFAVFIVLGLVVNPLLRLTRLVKPLNRGEMMALFAAMFVSAGISSFGLADQLIPIIATPFNGQWNIPQREWASDVIPHLNERLYITDTSIIAGFRDGFGTREGLWGKIPWLAWARPLGFWMIFVLAIYGLFYSLSMLLYHTWGHREKLVFPLARLPEYLIHDDGASPGTVSGSVKNALFWVGFGAVFLLLSYNGACQAGWFGGLEPLRLGIDQGILRQMLSNSVLHGIAGGGRHYLMFLFIFTAVGIGYLLPLEISFSLWGYHIFALMCIMVAIWTGAGASSSSFPSGFLMENNFITSLGGGGLLAFSAVYLVKMVMDRWTTASEEGGSPTGWQWATRLFRAIGWGGALFLLSTVVAVVWLRWNDVSVMWSLAFMAVVVLMTVGVMRVVAEGGVHWFQIHTGPLHLARLVGGVKMIPAAILAPLVPIYWVFFADIKTYMAPAVINSFKMQEETRASRRMFHAIVVLSILLSVAASTFAILYLAYEVGADRSCSWFFSSGPQSAIDRTQRLVAGIVSPAARANPAFYALGAAWVVLSVFMRRRFFWWLHPIGLVMMTNPLMTQLSFPFFLGWLCKKLATKYGGRHTFTRMRPFFIGIILGELAACFVWAVLANAFHLEHVGIDINRYSP